MTFQSIPNYKNYRSYKPYLRMQFNHSCVYCEAREPENGGTTNFCVEHYKPKHQFPELETIYENLLYACNKCNSNKGTYWPNKLQEILQQVILNPRVDDISKHVDKNLPLWKSKTYRGEWNIQKLKLSSQANIKRREKRIQIEETIAELENYKAQINPEDSDSRLLLEKISDKINLFRSMISGSMD